MPGDRHRDRWVDPREGAMERATSYLVLALAALALACSGGFDTPDLDCGIVEGRLLNANAGGFVYPFGRPDLKANVDFDGRFSMQDVPVETTEIIVIDGPDPVDATRRAQIVWGIEVQGAQRTSLPDLDVLSMPFAGAVLAAVQPAGGATAVAARFTVVGTDQVDVVAVSGTEGLFPLPPGIFEITASMAGFETTTSGTQVLEATTMPLLVPLPVDLSSSRPGCAATGLCRNSLVCNPADGFCYECVGTLPMADVDCVAAHGTGSTCSGFTCQGGTGATTGEDICGPCADDTQCFPGVCVTYGGERFCSEMYGAFSCPAGFGRATDQGTTRDVCVPYDGCASYRIAFGSACFDNSQCATLFQLLPPDVSCVVGTSGAGYCTGLCTTSEDCVIPGWTCSPGMPYGQCVPPPPVF